MATRQRFSMALALAVCGSFLSFGCNLTLNQEDPIRPPKSEELSSAQFSDIPVPLGFELRESPVRSLHHPGSYSFETNSFRSGRFLYSGRGEITDLASFYSEQMQNSYHGWAQVSQDVGTGSADLVFDKQESRSTIELFKKGSKTYVLIQVHPRNES